MAKLCNLFVLVSLLAALKWAQAKEIWVNRVVREKETVTNLQFYFHDTFTGNNPSAIVSIQPNTTKKYATLFGGIVMIDDPLTVTPDPNSKLVGRAQGLYGSAGQTEFSLIMAVSLRFMDGGYNGSSLSISGTNPASNPVRELPIVGGTGIFRMARGFAIAHTYFFNSTSGDAIVGYNVTVFTAE
ncbi:dirigent protein 23-like [Tripterygium wilfordii]|uniref:dirigent protein 23-like n=1 Tax=Tripterygium wilfordii TaxID=458696 RepID=UPI0018F8108F|nr:dirigent protein 23-like [Tripterygium wilfordii]